jgi:CheY-like chemotaxis protein
MHETRIVVVDDDDAIRSLVCALAREAAPCATIGEHFSSLHALHEVETGEADLLITNCHMPDMDGPTLVQKIRGMKKTLPIIMVSGSPEARELGEKAGIDKFVDKNRLNVELGEAIHTCLDDR